MKKIFLSIIALFTVVSMLAQEEQIRFGAKGGVNLSNFRGDTPDFGDLEVGRINSEYNINFGFHIGAFVEIPITNFYALQPEVLVSRQGSTLESKFSGEFTVISNNLTISSTQESITKLTYLNIPLIQKFYIKKGVSLQIGPQIGFLLNAKLKTDRPSFSFTGVSREEELDLKAGVNESLDLQELNGDFKEQDVKGDSNTVDFSVNFGVGYDFDFGLMFDARYNLGLTNIAEDSDVEFQNSVFQISVGYKF